MLLACSTVAAAAGLGAAPTAGAAVSCDQDGFLQPFVTVTGTDAVALRVAPGGGISFDPGADGGFVPCGTANVNDTITITVNGDAGTPQGLLIDLSGGFFAPGFEDEPGANDEIEFAVNLKGGTSVIPDALWIVGTPGPGNPFELEYIALTAQGINLNQQEANAGSALDADVLMQAPTPGVVKILGEPDIFGTVGRKDDLESHEGPALGAAAANLLQLEGGAGGDILRGSASTATRPSCVRQTRFAFISFNVGRRAECLAGGAGGDLINGFAGDEMVLGDDGQDTIRGHEGHDRLFGGANFDTIEGMAGNDRIDGGSGPDVLIGGRGRDRIEGGRGRDRCRGDAGRDRIDCEVLLD